MSSERTPHLTPQRQLVATALTMMEEASNTVPMAPDLWPEVPTSIGDLEATMKLIHATMPAYHATRELGVATVIRKSINPTPVTFLTTSTSA